MLEAGTASDVGCDCAAGRGRGAVAANTEGNVVTGIELDISRYSFGIVSKTRVRKVQLTL